jgi:hypothetical protein
MCPVTSGRILTFPTRRPGDLVTTFLFHFSALSVIPFWAAMILFPRAPLTAKLVASPFIVLPAALCYLALAAPHASELVRIFAAPSPESLASVMASPWAASMFWAYAGAFDLFVGRWIHLDAREQQIRHAFVAPILFVCVLFGPLAFTLYAIVRAMHARRR